LGEYLAGQRITATFFAIGSRAREYPEIPRRLRSLGHLVANHTYSHPNLVAMADRPEGLVDELIGGDEAIGAQDNGGMTFFRPPFGSWRQESATDGLSPVARHMNQCDRAARYVGPILWDITCHDYAAWRRGTDVEDCARHHIEEIERVGRGIVLMHDGSDEDGLRAVNRTAALTRLIVPALRAKGFQFIPLDRIPQVSSAMLVTRTVHLIDPSDKSLRAGDDGKIACVVDDRHASDEFGVIAMEAGRIAFRAVNGEFLSVAEGRGNEILANAPAIGASEAFEVVDLGGGRMLLRTSSGGYISVDAGGGLTVVTSRRAADTLSMRPICGGNRREA
jgi:peptidoglycan/xylan/chitin deacetylase (PgdA/CDA1 family)